jgi:hypothetical protein
MNQPLLEEHFFRKFFDMRLLELMKIIMVSDSASHARFHFDSITDEIIANVNKQKLIFLKY